MIQTKKKNNNWPFISKKKLYDIDAYGDTRQRKAIGHEWCGHPKKIQHNYIISSVATFLIVKNDFVHFLKPPPQPPAHKMAYRVYILNHKILFY